MLKILNTYVVLIILHSVFCIQVMILSTKKVILSNITSYTKLRFVWLLTCAFLTIGFKKVELFFTFGK